MYKLGKDVYKSGTIYYLPGNIQLHNSISVTNLLKKLGINSTQHTPGTTAYNQAIIGTKAHKLLELGEFNTDSTKNLYFMQAMSNLSEYKIEFSEIFCWGHFNLGKMMVVGIADCLVSSIVNNKPVYSIIDWKTTGQDNGMGVDTIIKSFFQLILYREMIMESYCYFTDEIIVYELHKARDIIMHKISGDELHKLTKFLLDCIVSGKNFREIAGQSEVVLELRQRVQRSKIV
jgi:hypothetical protein